MVLVLFGSATLWAAAGLLVVYIGLGFVGWSQWRRGLFRGLCGAGLSTWRRATIQPLSVPVEMVRP
jgi:uncharacterized membrane protein YphA (DoxX/SURF4 family)